MSDDISPADAARHDEIFDEGWSLIEGEVLLDGSGPSGRPGCSHGASCRKRSIASRGVGD